MARAGGVTWGPVCLAGSSLVGNTSGCGWPTGFVAEGDLAGDAGTAFGGGRGIWGRRGWVQTLQPAKTGMEYGRELARRLRDAPVALEGFWDGAAAGRRGVWYGFGAAGVEEVHQMLRMTWGGDASQCVGWLLRADRRGCGAANSRMMQSMAQGDVYRSVDNAIAIRWGRRCCIWHGADGGGDGCAELRAVERGPAAAGAVCGDGGAAVDAGVRLKDVERLLSAGGTLLVAAVPSRGSRHCGRRSWARVSGAGRGGVAGGGVESPIGERERCRLAEKGRASFLADGSALRNGELQEKRNTGAGGAAVRRGTRRGSAPSRIWARRNRAGWACRRGETSLR